MLGTLALTLFVVGGLAFIFTALIVEERKNREHPEARILRETEEIIMQASRLIRREAARVTKTTTAA